MDIANCFPRDTGEYVCRAWNDLGEDFARATLKCGDDLTGQPPWFTEELQPIEDLNEGDSGHFEGRVEPSKDPDLRTEWYLNGKPIRTGKQIVRYTCLYNYYSQDSICNAMVGSQKIPLRCSRILLFALSQQPFCT